MQCVYLVHRRQYQVCIHLICYMSAFVLLICFIEICVFDFGLYFSKRKEEEKTIRVSMGGKFTIFKYMYVNR